TQILAWTNVCNHSFQLGRWIRSIRDHDELVSRTKKFPMLLHWAEYRRSYVVACLADSSRLDGLFRAAGASAEAGAKWKDYYFWAGAALGRVLEVLRTVRELEEVPAIFNQACAYTLRAQFQVETAILDNKLGDGLKGRLLHVADAKAWEAVSRGGEV